MKSRAKRYEKLDFLGEGQVRREASVKSAFCLDAEVDSPPFFFAPDRGCTKLLCVAKPG